MNDQVIRVLLIEEDPGDTLIVRESLAAAKENRFRLVEVDRLATGLKRLAEERFDVVVLDPGLPDAAGLEGLHRLRGAASWVPVIVLTGLNNPKFAAEAVRHGAQDYLIKSKFDSQSLAQSIRYSIRQQATQTNSINLIEAIGDGVIVVDEEGIVRFLNVAAQQLLGQTADQLIGSRFGFPLVAGTTSEIDIVQPDGKTCAAKLRAVNVLWEGERMLLASLRDITERNCLQEQLLQAQKMEEVGTLAGGVAHDFNNLLTVILGYTEIVLGKLPWDSPIRGSLEEIFRAGESGKALADQLLAFSRKQPSEMQVLDLNDSVEKTVKILPRVIPENIRVNFKPATDLGQVKADANQTEQVLLNLAVNARDAMPEGGVLNITTANVTLGDEYAHTHLEVGPGPYILLTVTDNGQGMDEETRKRIFEPFFTTKATGKGTGLGLAATHGIVKQHGGRVYSEPGVGTTFKIYWPRVDARVEQLTVKPKQVGVMRGSESILVAEDEEGVRRLIKSILEEEGYKLWCASTVEQAEKVFQEHANEIALLVSDLVMPGGKGPELYQRLAKKYPGLKVLFISGYSDPDILQNLVLDPHTPFLRKPFSAKKLVQKVREVLDS